MRNISDKPVEKIKTHFVFSSVFPKTVPFMKNVEKYGTARQATDDNIILHMLFAYWITKATDTHSGYAIIIAFPRQQWLRERVSTLGLYVHCLSCVLTRYYRERFVQ
jgi:hypothetical protein